MPNKRIIPPGDIRTGEQAGITSVSDQPISERQKALVARAYKLFEFFKEKEMQTREEMREARRMRMLRHEERSFTAPASNALNSCIDNVIADQIDNMPEAKMVPEREETANSAEEMSDIVSYVLYQAKFPEKYQQVMEDAAVTGTGVTEVFWDEDADDGRGMVNVLAWCPEDFYPDPMYEDIQDGRACFKAVHTTVAWVEEHFPDVRGYVKADEHTKNDDPSSLYDDVPEGDSKTVLLDYWYKRYDAKKRKYRVHLAKIAGHALLYCTEPGLEYGGPKVDEYKEGVYAHGLYPFVLYKYNIVRQEPFGKGLIHSYMDTQKAIDRYTKYIDDNARASSKQRHFVRKNSGINPEDIADMSKEIIEWEGADIREVLQTVQANPLNNQVFQIMNMLIDNMKQDSGQNQFSRGEGGLGVTAASAIQALQEAGGKTSRMHTERYKNSFRSMVEQIMWVLSEYMEPERKFMIVGGWDSTGNMENRLVQLLGIKKEGDELPKPAYTVRVQVQKNNPLQIQMDNEFVNQVAQVCAQAGQPLPPEAVIGLFEGYRTKSSVLKAVQQNSLQLRQMQELQAQVEQLTARLASEQKMRKGLQSALTTQGGGSALAEQQQAADYTGVSSVLGESEEEQQI